MSPAGRLELSAAPAGPIAVLNRYLPRWTTASVVPAVDSAAEAMRASVLYCAGSVLEMSTTATSRDRKSMTYARVSVELMTSPRGFFPPSTSCRSSLSERSVADRSWIRTIFDGSCALAGGLMLGAPAVSSVTRSSRLVAATATKPSAADRLKATANGFVLNSFTPTGSKFTPSFMLSVPISVSWAVLIVDRQLWTFTLNLNGPLGEEHVPETYEIGRAHV